MTTFFLWGIVPSGISFFTLLFILLISSRKNIDIIGSNHKDATSSLLSIIIYFFISSTVMLALLQIVIQDMLTEESSVLVTSGLKSAILLVLSGFIIQFIYYIIRCLFNGINSEWVKSDDHFTVLDKLTEEETSWIISVVLIIFCIICLRLGTENRLYYQLLLMFAAIFLGKVAWLNTSPLNFLLSILRIFKVSILTKLVGIIILIEGVISVYAKDHLTSATIGMCAGGLLGFILFMLIDLRKIKKKNAEKVDKGNTEKTNEEPVYLSPDIKLNINEEAVVDIKVDNDSEIDIKVKSVVTMDTDINIMNKSDDITVKVNRDEKDVTYIKVNSEQGSNACVNIKPNGEVDTEVKVKINAVDDAYIKINVSEKLPNIESNN